VNGRAAGEATPDRSNRAAVNDILEQAAWYQEQSGTKTGRQVGKSSKFNPSAPGGKSRCRRAMLFQSHRAGRHRRMPVPHFPKHLVFYRLQNEEMVILRIVHVTRDLESLF
jgi:plasmid stabilization system protein ParE